MAYTRNQPVALDDLDVSQPTLVNNTNGADDSFGVDHYKFSDITANNGFHNRVTTPLIVGSAHPATTTNPIFYAMQDSANVGVIQYSRGPSNAVPSPLTKLHSTAAALVLGPGATANMLDFTGINIAYGKVIAFNAAATFQLNEWDFAWNGSVFTFRAVTVAQPLQFQGSGNILQIKNTSGTDTYSNVYWTLDLFRIQ